MRKYERQFGFFEYILVKELYISLIFETSTKDHYDNGYVHDSSGCNISTYVFKSNFVD